MAGPQTVDLVVDVENGGQRLDAWLAVSLHDTSRSRIRALIEDGHVRVDGALARPSQKTRPGQAVSVEFPAPIPARPQPEDVPLEVVFEDEDLLVVEKPAGMVVHPGAGRISGTLVNALLHRVKDLSGVGGVVRPGIVHRLDRGTSGLLVVAKNDGAHHSLARQFAGRTVTKRYLAVVWGIPFPSRGAIDAPIGRDVVHRKRMTTRSPRGRPALSVYSVVEVLDGAALVEVRIHTGRTHQIRVHMAAQGHPVVGDPLYRGRGTSAKPRADSATLLRAFPRPALHAAHLEFDHPRSQRRIVIESPLPDDIQGLVAALR